MTWVPSCAFFLGDHLSFLRPLLRSGTDEWLRTAASSPSTLQVGTPGGSPWDAAKVSVGPGSPGSSGENPSPHLFQLGEAPTFPALVPSSVVRPEAEAWVLLMAAL